MDIRVQPLRHTVRGLVLLVSQAMEVPAETVYLSSRSVVVVVVVVVVVLTTTVIMGYTKD